MTAKFYLIKERKIMYTLRQEKTAYIITSIIYSSIAIFLTSMSFVFAIYPVAFQPQLIVLCIMGGITSYIGMIVVLIRLCTRI